MKRNPDGKKDADHTPLGREQSKEAALQFAAEHTVPLKLLRDVKVVQFGTPSKEFSTMEKLILLNFRSRWTDAPSKVVFENRVELSEASSDGTQGPSYNVYAIDTNDNGKKLRYPIAKGSSPDDVWSKVSERQKHVLHRNRKGQIVGQPVQEAASPSARSPNGGKMSPIDQILRKVSPLGNVWGLEKFGFIDLTCLKAMEGQPGVEETVYKYVNEREGWVQEQMKLRDLLTKRGQKLRLKPRANKGSQHLAGDKAVEKVLENLVKKVCAWNEKIEVKLSKQKEREEKKKMKEQENEKRKKEKALSRQQARQSLVDDLELDGATLMPPTTSSITKIFTQVNKCSQIDIQRILEVWSLAQRFHGTLDINVKDIPSIEDMMEVYFCDPFAQANICVIFKSMIEFLVGELCEESMKIIVEGDQNLRRADFVPPTRNSRMVNVSENNWEQVLHRYMYTVAISARISGKENLHYINYPLDNVHPYHIIDSITSGPTLLELMNGDLNLLLSDEAEQRIAARQDALSLRRSMELLNKTPLDEMSVLKNDRMLKLVLNRLFSRSVEAGGSLWDICFLGPESCLEARLGYPMDMSHVLSRVECLVYQMEESCFASFASDVFFACKILQTACQNGGNKIGTEKVIARKANVLNSIFQTLKELYGTYTDSGIDGLLQAFEGEQGEDDVQVYSLAPRSISPPDGACFICWAKDTNDAYETCYGCKMVAHVDCLEREWRLGSLKHGDEKEMQCMLCCSYKAPQIEYRISTGRYGSLWKLVRYLHDYEFAAWNPSDKIELLHMVSLLVSESPGVRERLDEEEELAKSVRAKLLSARNDLKVVQQEIKTMEDKKDLVGHRSIREAEIKRERLVMKISKLEQDTKTFSPSRMVPLGFDRHWNKYWSLPKGALRKGDPMIIVEEGFGLLGDVSTSPNLGFYRGPRQVDELLAYLNPEGQREKFLKEQVSSLNPAHAQNTDMEEGTDLDCDEQVSTVPAIQRLQDALIEYCDGLSDASYHEIRGKPMCRERWKILVREIASAEQAVAAIVLLERMLDPSCYKVHWRLWAIPAPNPAAVKTLGSAWMRLETLKKAVKNSSNQTYLLCMLDNEDRVHPNSSDRPLDEDTTIADQEMALQLDAELNQRRGSRSRRNWQILSPRDRSKRSDRNLRDVSTKYYGEDEQDEEQESSEQEQQSLYSSSATSSESDDSSE